jgi:hypothetical protein
VGADRRERRAVSTRRNPLQVPMEISFHGVAVSPRHEARLRREAERLHRFARGLVSCRVAVERPGRSRHTANPWRVRVEVTMPPGKDLVVSKTSRDDEAPDALLLTVREAFQALERRLKRTVALRRGDVKRH